MEISMWGMPEEVEMIFSEGRERTCPKNVVPVYEFSVERHLKRMVFSPEFRFDCLRQPFRPVLEHYAHNGRGAEGATLHFFKVFFKEKELRLFYVEWDGDGIKWEKVYSDGERVLRMVWLPQMVALSGLGMPNELEREVLQFAQFSTVV